MELPDSCNTPDGATIDNYNNIILAVPNFNSSQLYSDGIIPEEYPARMMLIDTNNQLHNWYNFKPVDLHPVSGKNGPMDCAFGPDGNLYVNDNQFFYGLKHASRLLRINIENDKPVNCDILVEGFMLCNGMVWRDSCLYVTETILEENSNSKYQKSAVYKFNLNDLNPEIPIYINPYDSSAPSPYLFSIINSNGRLGFGADGAAFDDNGSLYVTTFEEGTVFKIETDLHGNVLSRKLFANTGDSSAGDGIIWHSEKERFYVADMFRNAIKTIDIHGNVSTLWENDDTEGSAGLLDAPAEVLLRGNQLVVINMDSYWDDPDGYLKNKTFDKPYTISVFDLP